VWCEGWPPKWKHRINPPDGFTITVRTESPEAVAWSFHETLLEVLRRLNQASERRSEVDGMEFVELERAMRDFWTIRPGDEHLENAVRLLTENGLVGQDAEPKYAWDRRRVLGERYRITSLGKAYLLRSISDSERIA
jgi:hypothetical protein